MTETGETLTLYQDAGGPRHYLDGKPVYAGSPMEVRLPGGWRLGRYEASWTGGTIERPRVVFDDGTEAPIGPDTMLRRPGEPA